MILMPVKEKALSSMLLLLVLSSLTTAATTDRNYTLGDDSGENASVTNIMGSSSGGDTFDSEGPSGAFVDLQVNGTPTYVSVSDRPGASASELGGQFDGTSDYLLTSRSLNAPTQSWDNTSAEFYPGPPTTPFEGHNRNYEGVFGRAIELWAKPTTDGARQDLVIDTQEHGIFISANNTWSMLFDDTSIDSNVAVDTGGDGWTHVMLISGTADLRDGTSAFGGSLLVDGIVVAASGTAYDPESTAFSIGANQSGDDNFYSGVLDDIRSMIWGDNSADLGQDDSAGGSGLNRDGENYGALDLSVDNNWISQEIASIEASLGGAVVMPGDVNLDGVVNDSDVTVFATNWLSEQIVDGQDCRRLEFSSEWGFELRWYRRPI